MQDFSVCNGRGGPHRWLCRYDRETIKKCIEGKSKLLHSLQWSVFGKEYGQMEMGTMVLLDLLASDSLSL